MLEQGNQKPVEQERGDAAALAPIGETGGGGASLGPPLVEDPVMAEEPVSGVPFSLRSLLLQKWIIVGVTLLVSGTAIPLIWLFVVPEYLAQGAIRVAPSVSRIVFRNEENGLVPLYRSFVNTQVSVIRSPKVLARVLDRKEVRETAWYTQARSPLLGGRLTPLEGLREGLAVRPRRDTELIDVALSAREAADAKLIVDAVLEEYKRYNDETLQESDVQRRETLEAEYKRLRNEITGLTETKHNVASELGTLAPEELRSQLTTYLSVLQSQYSKLQRDLAMAQWRLEALNSGKEEGDAASGAVDALQLYARDGEWRTLKTDVEGVEHDLEVARQQFGESHPRIRQLIVSVAHVKRLLQARETQLDAAGPAPVLTPTPNVGMAVIDRSALERQENQTRKRMELLAEEIISQRQKVAGAGRVAQDIARFDEEIAQAKDLYETVRTRLQELALEDKAPARIAIQSYAIKPSRPHRDRRVLLSVMALFGALGLGMSIAYLRVSTDPRIREAGDVRQALRVPFLGQLPPLPTSTDVLGGCSQALMENVRIVRTALLERLGGTESKAVLITSSTSEAGKTSLAALLSRSLAFLGKRVLLVEADLRRPSLSARLGVESSPGLAGLLTGTADDGAAIRPAGVGGFDVLVAGDPPEGFNSELLANGVFGACLQRWKKQYDLVLLDSPPVLPVADARILAGQVDGTIMVLRSSHTRRAEVIQAYADLSAAGARLLGTILVGARTGPGYGYGYAYSGQHLGSGTADRRHRKN